MFTIRKTGVLVSLFLLSLVQAAAEPGNRDFSLSPHFGILWGQGEEILYKYPGKDQYVSQLLWDMKPLVYVGFSADTGPADPFGGNGFIAAGSLKFGLPLRTGIIEDRDWDNRQYDYLTHFSRHDAHSQNAIFADLSAGYSWALTDFLALGAYGEFSFMYLSWAAENGYAQYPVPSYDPGRNYPEWDESYSKIFFNGMGIVYTQNWFIFSPALSIRGRINRLFSVEGTVQYSPFIYAAARDDHLLAGKIFFDYLSWGHYIKGGGKFVFLPAGKIGFSLSLSYTRISGPRGNSYQADSGQGADGTMIKNSYDGGAGYSALDIELAVKLRFFGAPPD